jgi:hypothetical protein
LRAGQPGLAREGLITIVVLTIMAINVVGIRQSAWVVNTLTVGKLTPLVIFILLGLPYVSFDALRPEVSLTWAQISASALYLIFAYGGYEVVGVPAGETRDPKRAVPFAMITTIIIVGIVMTLVQVVAMGTLPNLAASRTPLADASLLFLGAWGAILMTTGGAVSMTGNNMGQALSGSRNLYALAEQNDLPAVFGYVHPRFRTPAVAIVFTALIALGLALSGNFATLAASSAVSRLIVYAASRVEGRTVETRIEALPAVTVDGRVVSSPGDGLSSDRASDEEGRFDERFAKAANAIERAGQQSDVVETDFGYHVILLVKRVAARQPSLEERRALVADEVYGQRARELRDQLVATLRERSSIEVVRNAERLTALVQAE